MFWHNYKYAFKTLVKNRALVFWTLAFPFMLAILFNVAFARLHDYDIFEAFDVAVTNEVEDENFKTAFKSLSEGDDQLFKLRDGVSHDEAEALLEKEEIEGYVYADEGEIKVRIKNNGSNQTVLSMAVEQIVQSEDMVENIVATQMAKSGGQTVNLDMIKLKALAAITDADPNIRDDSHVMNMVSVEFFTLIAMACMQGAILSTELMNRCLPNVSERGKRVAIAPTKKSVVVASSLLAGYTMLFASVMLLIVFMRFVLGVEFGDNLALVCVVAAAGSFAATMMGLFLGVALKTNENAKQVIVLTVTMAGCLFAGMFGGNKGFFDNVAPIINKISPVGMITDGFYALFYYEDLTRFYVNIASLLAVSAIFFALSVRGLRRQRYDSI